MGRIKDYYIDLINLQSENKEQQEAEIRRNTKRKSKTYKLWNLTITITINKTS